MPVTRVDHVGIAVPDIGVALNFWRDVLGLRVTHTETNNEQGVHEAMLQATSSGLGWPGATTPSPTQIQLLAPTNHNSTIAKFIDKRGPGLQQLAFTVDDVYQVTRRFTALGIRVLYDEPKRGTAGSLINFVHPGDTGGVLIELVQQPPTASLPHP